jgi:hypothetical protein
MKCGQDWRGLSEAEVVRGAIKVLVVPVKEGVNVMNSKQRDLLVSSSKIVAETRNHRARQEDSRRRGEQLLLDD